MYSRIVVPLDGSKLSESILLHVRALLRGLGIPVELLLAVDPEVVSVFVNPGQGLSARVVETDMKRKGLEYLDLVAGSLSDRTAVSCSVEVGKPAEVIVTKSAADPATLITMATHGRSGLGRWIIGSVARQVLLTAANPLVLARPGENPESTGVASLKSIIVPLDGSGFAEKVLPHAVSLAKRMDLDVMLLRAYELPPVAYYASEGYAPNLDDFKTAVRENARQYLDGVLQGLQPEGLSRVSTLLVEGDAAGNINDVAKRTPGSLVALCTHGRSGISRLFLGSVADRAVRESGGPVLLVRSHPVEKSPGRPL